MVSTKVPVVCDLMHGSKNSKSKDKFVLFLKH